MKAWINYLQDIISIIKNASHTKNVLWRLAFLSRRGMLMHLLNSPLYPLMKYYYTFVDPKIWASSRRRVKF